MGCCLDQLQALADRTAPDSPALGMRALCGVRALLGFVVVAITATQGLWLLGTSRRCLSDHPFLHIFRSGAAGIVALEDFARA